MKTSLLLFSLTLLTSSIGFPKDIKLPDATITQEAIGGEVLLIRMQEYLVISGKESQALEKELGVAAKKGFIKDMVTEKSYDSLVAAYDPRTEHKTVQSLLLRYSNLTQNLNSKKQLN